MRTGKVAIVDDDEAVRLSTASLVDHAGYDVVQFHSGDDFLQRAAMEEISCILLDMQMPGRNGAAVLRELGERGEVPPVVVITGHGDIAVAVEAMKLGAFDFMEKPYAPEELLRAIETAQQSRRKNSDARAVSKDAVALVETLSQRQRQVLQGILKGQQNKIIAFELGLSIRTIEAYRAQLLEKLGVRGTAEAVRLALAAGLGEG